MPFANTFSLLLLMLSTILCFQISPGSKASRVNLSPGDIILVINGVSAENMMHSEAQNLIKDATYQLTLTVERSEVI